MTTSVIIIPARLASTRLPEKPLLQGSGKFLIQHVYEQAQQAKGFSEVIIATDHPRIMSSVQSFGGHARLTREDHPSGTDRIAELAENMQADIIVNLQGDEPEIEPGYLELVRDLLIQNPLARVATLATPIRDRQTLMNPNCVKVVMDCTGRAMYFSRASIPYVRDGEPNLTAEPPLFYLHLGIYAYRREELLRLAKLSADAIEMTEKLEQLRFLRAGVHLQVGVVPAAGEGIDTPEDYARFLQRIATRKNSAV